MIVGGGAVGRLTAKRLLERPELGLRPVGFLDTVSHSGSKAADELPVLGLPGDFDRVRDEHAIEPFSAEPNHLVVNLLRRSRRRRIEVSIIPPSSRRSLRGSRSSTSEAYPS